MNYKDDHIRDNICDQMAGRLKDVLRMNPHLRHTASLKELLNWLQQLNNDQIADIEKKKTSAVRKEEKKPVAGTTTEKKITTYSTGSFDRDNAKAKRLENERRLGLCHHCKQPGHISATCPNKDKPKVINEIQELDPKN